jgi:hypothetical protein
VGKNEKASGFGVIATADSEGKVNTAIYSKPIMIDIANLIYNQYDSYVHKRLTIPECPQPRITAIPFCPKTTRARSSRISSHGLFPIKTTSHVQQLDQA